MIKIFLYLLVLYTAGHLVYADDADFLPVNAPDNPKNYELIRHQNYILAYDEDAEQAAWVTYELLASELDGRIKRANNFRPDIAVPSDSANLSDYKGSGFDRGHLAPAADFTFSETAMSESFYLSNMSPQRPEFNRGIWKALETQVRSWTLEFSKVYVVTGGVLPLSGKHRSISEDWGPTESWCLKSIIKSSLTPKDRQWPLSCSPIGAAQRQFHDFEVTVDEVETATGLDFFSQLPDSSEEKIESRLDKTLWSINKVIPRIKAHPKENATKQSKSGQCGKDEQDGNMPIAPGRLITNAPKTIQHMIRLTTVLQLAVDCPRDSLIYPDKWRDLLLPLIYCSVKKLLNLSTAFFCLSLHSDGVQS